MKRLVTSFGVLATLAFAAPTFAQITAVPNSMNFQGRLAKPDGTPVADGTYSVLFSLYNALTGGTLKWSQTKTVTVRNGAIATTLDTFPAGTFSGNLWLEIKIGTSNALTPRQPLVSVAYAMKAGSVPDGSITNSSLAGGITADKFASNAFNPLAWLLGGNSGVTSGFIGTTDNNPLVFKVNGHQAARYSYATNGTYQSINVLGGSELNSIGTSVVGATIAGGGQDFIMGTDYPNIVTADFGTIGGGVTNFISNLFGTISGGSANTVNGFVGTVAGGDFNTAGGDRSVVAGGNGNITAGIGSAIGGGFSNRANGFASTAAGGQNDQATADYSTVSGGQNNTSSSGFATVAGGQGNTASGFVSTVSGGDFNAASGDRSMVLGGNGNTAAGVISLAAGFRAKSNHDGTFVWADATNVDFASSGVNQFLIRASGGVGINTADPAGFALNVAGAAQMTGFRLPTGAAPSLVLVSDAAGSGTWGQISGASIANGTITSDKFASGAGSGWGLTGNSGTNPSTNFLGTTDNQPLLFRVNNKRSHFAQYATTPDGNYTITSINIANGYELNSITAGVGCATIAGGGSRYTQNSNGAFTDAINKITDNYGTIGGGTGNTAGNNNASFADARGATVAGGQNNTASGLYTTVGGGTLNLSTGAYDTIAGGWNGQATGGAGFIGGGWNHRMAGQWAVIGGGYTNVANGSSSTVGGGNTNSATNSYATVPGGYSNVAAGSASFAAGSNSKANHDGTFVWADSTGADFASSATNQFNVRASGGTRIFSNSAATTGVVLAAGGGSWSSASDRNLKTNFQNVDTLDVLEKLAAIPLTTWNYKANTDIRHMGAMAQDFYAAFGGLGLDDKHIDTVDADGVAFAAIQGLNRKLEATNAALKKEVDELKAKVSEIEALKKQNAEIVTLLKKLQDAQNK